MSSFTSRQKRSAWCLGAVLVIFCGLSFAGLTHANDTNSPPFYVAVLITVLSFVALAVLCALVLWAAFCYTSPNAVGVSTRLRWGLGCFLGLLVAVVFLSAANFSTFHQYRNFVDNGFNNAEQIGYRTCVSVAPQLTVEKGSSCLIAAQTGKPLGAMDSIYWAAGNLSPAGSGIQSVSTTARVLVFEEMIIAVVLVVAFGSLFLTVIRP